MNRIEKIAAATKSLGADAMLICSMENLYYATGMIGLEGMVLITANGKGYCFTDFRYIEQAEKIQGFTVAKSEKRYPECAAQLASELSLGTIAFEDGDMSYANYVKYSEAFGDVKLVGATAALDEIRECKDQFEIDSITAAQRIAERALSEILPLVKPGAVEQELSALLDYTMAKYGSTGVSFSTIFVSGAKSSLPHGHPGDKKIEAGDFVTIDFGAIVNGYHSDMTRTFAVGHATEEMKKVYSIVLEAQLAGIEAMAVGISGHDVDKAARDIIEKAGYGEYFGHGLGHSLGLRIHENPRAGKSASALFKSGNIITIEPGIYLPGKFGVRIEDMIYVSDTEKLNLTQFDKQLTVL